MTATATAPEAVGHPPDHDLVAAVRGGPLGLEVTADGVREPFCPLEEGSRGLCLGDQDPVGLIGVHDAARSAARSGRAVCSS